MLFDITVYAVSLYTASLDAVNISSNDAGSIVLFLSKAYSLVILNDSNIFLVSQCPSCLSMVFTTIICVCSCLSYLWSLLPQNYLYCCSSNGLTVHPWSYYKVVSIVFQWHNCMMFQWPNHYALFFCKVSLIILYQIS